MVIIRRIKPQQPEPAAPSGPTLGEQFDAVLKAGPLRGGIGERYAQQIHALLSRGMTSSSDIARVVGLPTEKVIELRKLLRSAASPQPARGAEWWRL